MPTFGKKFLCCGLSMKMERPSALWPVVMILGDDIRLMILESRSVERKLKLVFEEHGERKGAGSAVGGDER